VKKHSQAMKLLLNLTENTRIGRKRLSFIPNILAYHFFSHKIFEFDKSGNLLLEESVNEQGEVIAKRIYYYSDKNLLIRNDNSYVDKPKSNYSKIYRYDTNDEIIETIDSSNQMIKTISFIYPAPGLKKTVTKINNKPVNSGTKVYDTINLSEKSYAYDENDSLYLTSENYYESHGKRLKEITFNTDVQPITTRTFEYDSSGKEIYEKIVFHSDNVIEEIKRTIDSINQTRDTKVFLNGKLKFGSRIYFDNYGNKVKTEYFENDYTVTDSWEYEYTYDKNGNWTEKRESKDSVVYTVIYREIKYYN
jgi:YD repeat-containing protein